MLKHTVNKMLQIYFLAVLLVQAHAELKCEEEIKTVVIEDYEQIVGNWTLVLYWDNTDNDDEESEENYLDEDTCITMQISRANEDDVLEKQNSCKDDDYFDFFDYANAKYKLDSPEWNITNSLIAVGSDKTIMEYCGFISSLEIRKVSDDQILMINHEYGTFVIGMLSKTIPSWEELDCFMDKIDVVKGLEGVPYCYL